MYIRRTTIKSRQSGEPYHTHRLVESSRVDGKVKQHTLLNLGSHFEVKREQWSVLTARITHLLGTQSDFLESALPVPLEAIAQNLVAKLHLAGYGTQTAAVEDLQTVDIDSLEIVRPRQVGVEQMALHAMQQLGFVAKLRQLDFNRHQLAASIGNIIGRMTSPGSERATLQCLQQQSGLGELLGYDYENMGHDRLYTASDLLWKHKETLETWLYEQECNLFSLQETVTLYDLTNTFFEGEAAASDKAQRGRSKEKRRDCPLITLGLVLDGSGFPRRSQHFAGNVSEPKTLQFILKELKASTQSLIVMDAGIATEENIVWLIEHGYRYLVVSRKMQRQFDPEKASIVKDVPGKTVRAHRIVDKETGEVFLHCHSEAREEKENAMVNAARKRFEAALNDLHNGLAKKGTIKKIDLVQQRIGRLKQKYSRAAQHYSISVEENDGKAIAIQWEIKNKLGSQATHLGVYCLRTNQTDWDETMLWKTYTMLTDLEAVFRSLKSELGMRPVHHQKEERIEGHLFITLLAYHFVHTLRSQLKAKGIHDSWDSLRRTMANRQRVTVTLKRADGKTLHVRKTTRAEAHQVPIIKALELPLQFVATQLMLA